MHYPDTNSIWWKIQALLGFTMAWVKDWSKNCYVTVFMKIKSFVKNIKWVNKYEFRIVYIFTKNRTILKTWYVHTWYGLYLVNKCAAATIPIIFRHKSVTLHGKGPSIYYVSISLDFFWPTHYVSINTVVVNVSKTGSFLDPPPPTHPILYWHDIWIDGPYYEVLLKFTNTVSMLT